MVLKESNVITYDYELKWFYRFLVFGGIIFWSGVATLVFKLFLTMWGINL